MCSSSQKTDSLTGSNRRIPLHPAIGWWNLCSSDRHPNQMLGGVILLSPSPSQSTAQPPGLSRAAPPPHSRCTSPPLDRQVLTLSQGALTQWIHLFPRHLSFDFQLSPQLGEQSGRSLLPWIRDLPEELGSTRAHADKTNNAWSKNE